jgi:4-amino-4-deoxy-L-arabinose transferase-like glycosyltransferase
MTVARSWPLRHAGRIELAAVAVTLGLVAIAGATLIAHGISLGWDESVYASRSRSLVTDIPASVWKVYRPPGLPIIGLLGGVFGFTDANLRAVSLVLSVLTLATAWALTRMLWGPLAAMIGLLTLVGAPIVLDGLVLFQTDLPAAGLLLALMVLLWHQFERRPAPTRLLLAAAPIAAAAFYVRYGSIVAIGGIGLAAVLLWHRPMLRQRRLVGATVALAAVLFAPHLLEAIARTGSPIGIVTSASDQVNTTGPLEAAARYLGWLPAQLAHRLGFIVMLAGLGHGVIVVLDAIRRRALTATARHYLFLSVPAVVTAIGLVLTSHPEQRYVLFPVILAIVAGAGAVSTAVRWLRLQPTLEHRQRAIDVGIVGAIALAAVVVASVGARRIDALERDGDAARWSAEVGAAIRTDADGPCLVATTLAPIIGWYSGCEAVPFTPGDAAALVPAGDGRHTYVVFTDIDDRRASAATIDEYRALLQQGAAVIPLTGASTAAFRLGSD